MLFRHIAIAATATTLISLSGCGDDVPVSEASGDTTAGVIDSSDSVVSESPEPTEDVVLPTKEDLDALFRALGSDDVTETQKASEFTAEGSPARAYLDYIVASLNADIDAGTAGYASPGEVTEIDGGYELCYASSDDPTCFRWTDITGADGLVVAFDVNETPLTDVIRVGSGKPQLVGGKAEIEVLYAYQSPASGNLFIVGRATTRAEAIDLSSLFSATYRDPSGRQFKAADSTNPGELGADSTATFSTTFPAPAKIGGTVTLGFYDSSYNEYQGQFPTK